MEFDNGIPIYQQIVYEIKMQIVRNEMKPGERIASVRDLALEMGVNPNTMQKSLALLEREGLLVAERTSGRYVTSNQDIVESERLSLVKGEVTRFVSFMLSLGYSPDELIVLIKEYSNQSKGRSSHGNDSRN